MHQDFCAHLALSIHDFKAAPSKYRHLILRPGIAELCQEKYQEREIDKR